MLRTKFAVADGCSLLEMVNTKALSLIERRLKEGEATQGTGNPVKDETKTSICDSRGQHGTRKRDLP